MDNTGKFKPGTRFIGNVNGVEMEVVQIQNTMVVIKDLKGNIFNYGLKALEHCDVTITREGFVYGLDGTVYVQDNDRQGWTA